MSIPEKDMGCAAPAGLTRQQKAARTRIENRVDAQRDYWIKERDARLERWRKHITALESYTGKFFELKKVTNTAEKEALAQWELLRRLGQEWSDAEEEVKQLDAKLRPLAPIVKLVPKAIDPTSRTRGES